MRVRMTTSCELKEVPGIILGELQKIKFKLRLLSEGDFNYFSMETLAEQIPELRYQLSDLDLALEDAQKVLAGYASALSAPPDTTEEKIAEDVVDEKEV